MTQTTTLEPPRFALFELAYLLAGRTDAHANRTRELLGIPEIADENDTVYAAGFAGLVARGFIADAGVGPIPRNVAGVVALALGTASQWISLAVRTEATFDMSLLIEGERASCLIRRAPGPTFDFVFIQPGNPIADVAVTLVDGLLDTAPNIEIMVRSANTTEDAALLVLQDQSHNYRLGIDPIFPDDANWPAPDLVPVDSDRVAALAAVATLVDAHRIVR